MPGRNDGWDIWDWQVTCPHMQTSGATLGIDEDVPAQLCLKGDSRGNPCAICFVVFVQPGKTLEPPDRGDRTLTSLPIAYPPRAGAATSCQDWPGPSIACGLRDRAVPLSVLGPWHRMGMFVEDASFQVLDYWGGMPR